MKRRLPKDKPSFWWITIAWLVACLCSACDERTLVHTSHLFPESGWAKEDTVELQVPLTDSCLQADLYVEVRHRSHYPYGNLPFAVQVLPPDSLSLPTDSLNLMLIDTLAEWSGQGSGPLRQLSRWVRKLDVRHSGLYRVQLWHLLPDSLLPEVNDIGIRLRRRAP